MEHSQKLNNAIALYMEGIRDGRAREAVTKYTGDRYTQHSTGVADGIEGFVAFFEGFLERCPDRDIRIVRCLEDGQHVFCMASQSLNGGESRWLTTDLFDTDSNDKIIEHWDVISAWEPDTPAGRSQAGGTTEIADLASTEANKALVREFAERVLIGGVHADMASFVAEDLTQHDLSIADGREAWATHLQQQRVRYRSVFRLIGQGNFVVTYCPVEVGSEPFAVFDIFRLRDGKIVERWTNAEPVPEDTGNSGKF